MARVSGGTGQAVNAGISGAQEVARTEQRRLGLLLLIGR
jgi:hypothetical protein